MISWKTLDTNQPVLVKDSPDKNKAFKAYILIPSHLMEDEQIRGVPINEDYDGSGKIVLGMMYYNLILMWNEVELSTNNQKNLETYKMLEASGELLYPLKIVSEEGYKQGLTYEDFDRGSEIDPDGGWVYQDPS